MNIDELLSNQEEMCKANKLMKEGEQFREDHEWVAAQRCFQQAAESYVDAKRAIAAKNSGPNMGPNEKFQVVLSESFIDVDYTKACVV